MKDKKILILSIVGVLMLVSIVVATSYAYFTATVSGNKDTNNVVITNGVMSLEYKDGDEITLDNAVPGDSVTKTFTVKNTGNVSTNYTIYFSELINKFVDNTDLVYTLTSTDGGKSVAQTQVPDASSAIVSSVSIEPNTTHNYTLKITFLNKDEVQDDNQGRKFSTKLQINEVKDYEYPKLTAVVENLAQTDNVNLATDDPDNNTRYIGADPNNYVYFNCKDYSNQNDETCEKWRIIGSFKNITTSNSEKETLAKIVRNESLGKFMWDSKQGVGTSTASTWGSNDWTDSQLMMMLNPTDYLKSGYTLSDNVVIDSNGYQIYQNMGSYYNGIFGCKPALVKKDTDFDCTSVDFTSIGLQNSLTRNAIESVTWNLGSSNSTTPKEVYSEERGSSTYKELPTTWTGKIGLMYPSDYGYATSGGTTTDRLTCLSKNLGYHGIDDGYWSYFSDCYNNDYLFNYKGTLGEYDDVYWLLTNSNSYGSPWRISKEGTIDYCSGWACTDFSPRYEIGIRPTLYLKSNISVLDGDGSSSNPYQLNIQ